MNEHASHGVRRWYGVLALVIVLGALGTVVGSANAVGTVLLPAPTQPAGLSYSKLAANWWKWALAQPVATNPILDTTGAQCARGQSGVVWFLAGAQTPNPIVRNCTIPYGKTIVFPLVNAAYFAFPNDPPAEKTEAFIRSQVSFVEEVVELEVEVDGVPVLNPERYLERSEVFSFTLGANNILGLPAGQVLSPSVDSGYYLAISSFGGVGPHTIHFYAELASGFKNDVTYNITLR